MRALIHLPLFRRAGIAGALSLTLLASADAGAQTGPMSAPEAWDFLSSQNAELRRAYDRLPKRYGVDPAAEQQAIEEAQATVRGVVGRLQGRHRSAEQAFSTMQANIARLNEQIRIARYAQAATEAHRAVIDKHAQGEPAEDALLDKLRARVDELATEADESWQPVVDFFRAAETGHRTAAKQLRVSAAKRAERERTEKANAALKAAMREANAVRRSAEDTLAARAGPVEPATLEALQIATNKVVSADVGAGRYYLHRLQLLRLASALSEPDRDQAAAKAAEALEGGLVRSGRTRSSSLKVRFRAEDNWCYALALRFAGPDEGALSELSFDQRGRGAELQRFAIPQLVPGWQRLDGVCTLRRGRITARAKVDNEGSPLRYVVVGWPRTDVPAGLFAHAEVRPGDRCDFDAWRSYWENPVPGTVVKVAGRPRLVVKESALGEEGLQLMDVAAQTEEHKKDELTKPPPAPLPALPEYEFTGCPPAELATHKRSRILAKCYARVERRHARAIRRAERKVARADTDEDKAAADAALKSALEAEDADRTKTCGSKERRIAEAGRRAHDRLIGLVEGSSVPATIDRGQIIVEEERAEPTLR